ncbi:MAG: hypothetical protein GF417_01110 [Candidatus Latescibacteria bacterium]|nr:hypothetical protein [bacterium]MBD3423026.1 hypothetical protein [Candidatus Latescibacterota bacterium]
MRNKHTGCSGAGYHIIILHILAVITISMILITGCSGDNPETARDRTLTEDERYLVQLYVKIHKLETNLQNNPRELSKKLEELKSGADSVRIARTLDKLEEDPVKWIAVYNRINTLLERAADND